MSVEVTIQVTVYCDFPDCCWGYEGCEDDTEEEVVEEAIEYGWRKVGEKYYCKKHASGEEASGDKV